MRWIRGGAVFWAALIAELSILLIHLGRVNEVPFIMKYEVEYLWYNVIGCVLVVVLTLLFHTFTKKETQPS